MLGVSGRLVSFLLVIRDNKGMFLPTELFNAKSMGKKSSITKSCIQFYYYYGKSIEEYGYFMEIFPWKSTSFQIQGKKIGK